MAEERGATMVGDRAEARLDRFEQRFDSLEKDVAEIKGILSGFRMAFDQMDKRLSDLASQMDKRLTDLSSQVDRRFSTIQWVLGLLVALQVLVLGKLFLK